jgi:hypothetical protein
MKPAFSLAAAAGEPTVVRIAPPTVRQAVAWLDTGMSALIALVALWSFLRLDGELTGLSISGWTQGRALAEQVGLAPIWGRLLPIVPPGLARAMTLVAAACSGCLLARVAPKWAVLGLWICSLEVYWATYPLTSTGDYLLHIALAWLFTRPHEPPAFRTWVLVVGLHSVVLATQLIPLGLPADAVGQSLAVLLLLVLGVSGLRLLLELLETPHQVRLRATAPVCVLACLVFLQLVNRAAIGLKRPEIWLASQRALQDVGWVPPAESLQRTLAPGEVDVLVEPGDGASEAAEMVLPLPGRGRLLAGYLRAAVSARFPKTAEAAARHIAESRCRTAGVGDGAARLVLAIGRTRQRAAWFYCQRGRALDVLLLPSTDRSLSAE